MRVLVVIDAKQAQGDVRKGLGRERRERWLQMP